MSMNWTEEQYQEYLARRKAEAREKASKKPATVVEIQDTTETYTSDNESICFTIPFPPVTKKNHSRIVSFGKRCPTCKKGSMTKLLPSKQYEEYETKVAKYLTSVRHDIGDTITNPVNIKCLFYMQTRRKCDLTNLLEAIDDVMVKHGLIADDNYTIIVGHDGSRVLYSKDNPRTEIEITSIEAIKNE